MLNPPHVVAGLTALMLAACGAAVETTLSEAERILAETARAYRQAPAIVDEVRLVMNNGRTSMRESMSLNLGSGTDARITTQDHIFTAAGERVYMHRSKLPGKYFQSALDGDLVQSMQGVAFLPLPQIGLRSSSTPEEFIATFGLSITREVTLEGHAMVETEGRVLHELRFATANGSVVAYIDPATMFLVRYELTSGPLRVQASMTPQILDRLAEPIAFDTNNRRRVASSRQLVLGKGDMAPDFTLETLDGKTVRLSEHREAVVVLDFWATWCGPCRMTMPLLDTFTRWADNEGLAVHVYSVDMGERVKTNQQKRELVSRFLGRSSYTMTTLLDFDSAVALNFDVNGIPHMVVVGPDGRIIDVETGYNRNLVAHLQQVARDALIKG